MKIGVGLPASIPGVSSDVVLEWARQADSGPFSSEGEDLEGSLTGVFIFGCIIQDDI